MLTALRSSYAMNLAAFDICRLITEYNIVLLELTFNWMSATEIVFPLGTEIVSLVFSLTPQTDAKLSPDYGKGLHAWFLNCVREDDPALSRYLHDGQSEKPFSISRLQGDITTDRKQLCIFKKNTYQWSVTVLSPAVVSWMQQWLTHLPNAIALYNFKLNIVGVELQHPPTTYTKLLKTRSSRNFILSFISPTSFRKSDHHFPLPVPVNLFRSYLRRWNHFASDKYDADDFLTWIEQNVYIVRHQLETNKVAGGKRGLVTGFVGAVELNLAKNCDRPEYVCLYKALCLFSVYCGTGHKTTFGLGQTRLGWQTQLSNATTIAGEVLLAQRIKEIFEVLMSQQKRTGGKRATQVSKTRATIMARRERGESLKAIAQDLKMPYETVKTYVKLTRRLLK